jgi:hypothetical protein
VTGNPTPTQNSKPENTTRRHRKATSSEKLTQQPSNALADGEGDGATAEAARVKKAKNKPKGKGWFSLSGVMGVVFSMVISGVAAQPGQEQCWPIADYQQRAHQLYDEHLVHDALTVDVDFIEVNASAARRSGTVKKLMAIDDGGASASVKRDKYGFNSDYRLVQGHPPIRDAGGNLTQVIGVGSITVNVTTNKGLRTVIIRNVLHAPDFKVDAISHRQLKQEGFKFFDEEAETGCTTPQGLKIKFEECQNGLHYWNCNFAANESCTSLNNMSSKQLERVTHQCNTGPTAD